MAPYSRLPRGEEESHVERSQSAPMANSLTLIRRLGSLSHLPNSKLEISKIFCLPTCLFLNAVSDTDLGVWSNFSAQASLLNATIHQEC